jgi:hypothetical protein
MKSCGSPSFRPLRTAIDSNDIAEGNKQTKFITSLNSIDSSD